MNLQEAQKIAEKRLLAIADDFSLMTELSEEFDGCYVFYYQSDKYIKTRNFDFSLVGNGPLIVCKKNRQAF